MAKVVYFTRSPARSSSASSAPNSSSTDRPQPSTKTSPRLFPSSPLKSPRTPSPPDLPAVPNGILGPKSLAQARDAGSPSRSPSSSSSTRQPRSSSAHPPGASASAPGYPPFQSHLRRRSSTSRIPSGGRLNFVKFQTEDLDACIAFLQKLISSSAAANRVPLGVMRKSVKLMATGGGAHKFYDELRAALEVDVVREEEMECLVLGLGFVMEVPNEVFWYSDELVQAISHPAANDDSTLSPSVGPAPAPAPIFPPIDPLDPFPRPSPNPPQYSLSFDPNPPPAQFPCLLVNIGSGVSIIKVDDYGKFERISGTSLGGGTLWGLLSLLTGAKSFDDMLELADKGDNSSVDMLVGDIYGQGYEKIGLKSSTIASSFGKVFKAGKDARGPDQAEERKAAFKAEDISRSLLYAISNNIGQIAYMNAEKHNLDRIYFGGGFIRGHAATISTLSYAIRFWSKGTKRALFLRHEGYLGGIGAWLKNLDSAAAAGGERPNGSGPGRAPAPPSPPPTTAAAASESSTVEQEGGVVEVPSVDGLRLE